MQMLIAMQMQISYTVCMIVKFYTSNLCSVWPAERQERLLSEWLAANPCEPVRYDDKIGPKARRTSSVAALKERANLLRPTSRKDGELIVLPSWRAFAFGGTDLAAAIAAAGARRAALLVLDRGVRIEPDATGQAVAAEIAEFGRMVRNRVTGRTKAEIAEEVMAETQARAEIIKPFWKLPSKDYPTPKLLAMAGKNGKPMAPKTARDLLGRRPEVQHAYEIEQNREAGRRAGANPGRKPKA